MLIPKLFEKYIHIHIHIHTLKIKWRNIEYQICIIKVPNRARSNQFFKKWEVLENTSLTIGGVKYGTHHKIPFYTIRGITYITK